MDKQIKVQLVQDITFALNSARNAQKKHQDLHPAENSYLWRDLVDVVSTLENSLSDIKKLPTAN